MRKLLITTVLVAAMWSPTQAASGPVFVALVANGVGWGSAFAATAVGGALIQFGISAVLSAAVKLLGPKARQAELVRDLTFPTSLPPQRFMYGYGRAPGSPAPVRVKGKILFACYLLNSRPSVGPFKVLLDKREVIGPGNPYDFTGGGVVAANEPWGSQALCQYWIGRGDQTSPPSGILAEVPELFLPTDGWHGHTVLWVRFDCGPNDKRAATWPSTPPEVMVDGFWSKVWDPRAGGQDANNPDTWNWSANQALCTLDALRMNPIKPYDLRYLWRETFEWAADVADQAVEVKAGGTIPRYETNGLLVFSEGAELEDQVAPLAAAGAARFVRVGGRLGILPGIYTPPVMTISDVLSDQGMTFQRYRPTGDLVTEVSAGYVNPARQYEDAMTPTYIIPGAQSEDGGQASPRTIALTFVTDHRQGQRVAKINAMRSRMQKSVGGVFPPSTFKLVGGSVVTLALPAPYAGRNGIFEIEECFPGLDPVGSDGVAMRVALTMRETSPAVYAWHAATEEQDIRTETFSPAIPPVSPTRAIAVLSDASTTLVSGDTSIARVLFTFAPSVSPSVISYEWQFQVGGGLWQSGGVIDAAVRNGFGSVFGFLVPVQIGTSYKIRARAATVFGASDWVESVAVLGSAGAFLASAPIPVSAVGGSGQIEVTFQAPNDADYRALLIYAASVDDSGFSVLIAGPIYGAANSVYTHTDAGLGAAVTRFYFARSVDRNGAYSPFSASISATTT